MKKTQKFFATYEQVRYLCQFVTVGAKLARLNQKEQYQIELACDEACSNIVEHACDEQENEEIIASWEITKTAFVITLLHKGKPFDPDAVILPTELSAETPIDEVSVGGLGIHFMRQLMDKVTYQFGEEWHTVTLEKSLPNEEKEPIIYEELLNGVAYLIVNGRLDQLISPLLEKQISSILTENDPPKMIIDFSATPYMNSGGLRVIVSAWRKARTQKGDVVLVGLIPEVRETLEMVGFDKIFRIFETKEQAETYLTPPSA